MAIPPFGEVFFTEKIMTIGERGLYQDNDNGLILSQKSKSILSGDGTAKQQVGDVNSKAKGSGARYNSGKPDYSLIPMCTLDDEARVWAYGKEKYSARGECTCSAGNAARKLLEDGKTSAWNAGMHTKSSCESATQSMQSDKEQIDELGTKPTQNPLKPLSENVALNEASTLPTNSKPNTQELNESTGLAQNSTNLSSSEGAQSVNRSKGCTSTIATNQERLEECYAIPATLALDLSKGLTIGLSKHSHTCGVHRIVGATGAWNWAKGMAWSVPFACLQRHMAAWQRGEEVDAESGLPHLAHAMCNLRMLTLYAATYPEGDDRPKEFLTDWNKNAK